MIPLGNNQAFVNVVNPSVFDRNSHELLSGLGNGIHLITLSAWSLYIASHCIRRQAIEFLAPPLQLAGEDDVDDADEDVHG